MTGFFLFQKEREDNVMMLQLTKGDLCKIFCIRVWNISRSLTSDHYENLVCIRKICDLPIVTWSKRKARVSDVSCVASCDLSFPFRFARNLRFTSSSIYVFYLLGFSLTFEKR